MDIPPVIASVINPYHSIAYTVTRWDIFFNWITIITRNRLLQIFVPVSMVFCAVTRSLPNLGRQPIPILILDVIIYCIGFLAVLMALQAVMGAASAFLMSHRGVLGAHTMHITEAGLVERTDVNETLHRWPGVCRVFSFLGYLFIYVGENNVHQIPKRDLAPDHIAFFEAEVRSRMK